MNNVSGVRGVFDLESDGLLYEATKIWCICIKDLGTHKVHKFGPSEIETGLDCLRGFKLIAGHNICGFDIPLIQKLYPQWGYLHLRDTLCMSKLADPERFSGHSLDSYGKQFKRYKPEHDDWSKYSAEMMHRCSEDVEINVMLYKYLLGKFFKHWDWLDSLKLEQEFAIDQAHQEMAGVDIDVDKALALIDRIDKEVAEIDPLLLSRMPKRVLQKGKTVHNIFKMNGELMKKVKDWFEIL